MSDTTPNTFIDIDGDGIPDEAPDVTPRSSTLEDVSVRIDPRVAG